MKRMCMQWMIRHGVTEQTHKDPTWIIGTKVKETKVESMEVATNKANISVMESIYATKITTKKSIAKEMIRLDLMFLLKAENLLPRRLEVMWHILKI